MSHSGDLQERIVGLLDRLESLRISALVGVVRERLLPVRLLDRLGVRVARHAEQRVVLGLRHGGRRRRQGQRQDQVLVSVLLQVLALQVLGSVGAGLGASGSWRWQRGAEANGRCCALSTVGRPLRNGG